MPLHAFADGRRQRESSEHMMPKKCIHTDVVPLARYHASDAADSKTRVQIGHLFT
jgi:hypothetical protein